MAKLKLLFNHLEDVPLMVAILFVWLRFCISEAIRVRVKDVDFGYNQLLVRDGKGKKRPNHRVAVNSKREIFKIGNGKTIFKK
ncbi:MAG TPA: hypothetical protein VF181_01635 [Balneolaceae bacterium]